MDGQQEPEHIQPAQPACHINDQEDKGGVLHPMQPARLLFQRAGHKFQRQRHQQCKADQRKEGHAPGIDHCNFEQVGVGQDPDPGISHQGGQHLHLVAEALIHHGMGQLAQQHQRRTADQAEHEEDQRIEVFPHIAHGLPLFRCHVVRLRHPVAAEQPGAEQHCQQDEDDPIPFQFSFLMLCHDSLRF